MRNPTLFGLKVQSDKNVTYDIERKEVTKATGYDLEKDKIRISEDIAFSLPLYISVNEIPLFPSKYEFINEGKIIYYSKTPPRENIRLENSNFLNERAKTKNNTISLKDLESYNVYKRKRSPSQNSVMKESAKNHVQGLIDKGILIIDPSVQSTVKWHWCHLVAFSMLPTEKAQKKNNFFCGTSACNGQMANIEAAVKNFIFEFKRPLGLEITVTVYQDTLVAKRIRYRIYDKKGSKMSHTEYFDALTDKKTDVLDYYTIYNRMVENFKY